MATNPHCGHFSTNFLNHNPQSRIVLPALHQKLIPRIFAQLFCHFQLFNALGSSLRPSSDRFTRPFFILINGRGGTLSLLLLKRKPPHHLPNCHHLTLRCIHICPRYSNDNSLLPCPLKPSNHVRFSLLCLRFPPLVTSCHKHSLR